jgi:hypothetical protein
MSERLQYACDEHGWCDYTPCPKCQAQSELSATAGSVSAEQWWTDHAKLPAVKMKAEGERPSQAMIGKTHHPSCATQNASEPENTCDCHANSSLASTLCSASPAQDMRMRKVWNGYRCVCGYHARKSEERNLHLKICKCLPVLPNSDSTTASRILK